MKDSFAEGCCGIICETFENDCGVVSKIGGKINDCFCWGGNSENDVSFGWVGGVCKIACEIGGSDASKIGTCCCE